MKKILLIIGLTALFSCSEDNNNENQNPSESNNTVILLENSSFNGNAVVTNKDGTIENSFFSNGILKINFNQNNERRVIKSLKIEANEPILLGRKEGDSIKLNYQNGILSLRNDEGTPIGSIAEFQLMNSLINSSNLTLDFPNTYLESDLDLMNIEWSPIGSGEFILGVGFKQWYGNFDGKNHKISNLKIASDKKYLGLFGRVYGSIKNLVIESGSIIFNGSPNESQNMLENVFMGSIVGFLTNGTVENCKNDANVTIEVNRYSNVGGVAGYGVVINSQNFGTIKGNRYVAGITGRGGAQNCQNSGNIICDSKSINGDACAAGISAGNLNFEGIPARVVITESINNGEIVALGLGSPTSFGIGGFGCDFSRCKNSGKVTGFSGSCGIGVGGTASFCENIGEIISENGMACGILGGASYPFSISYCTNKGNVTGRGAAGICSIGSINDSYNAGTITATGNLDHASYFGYAAGIAIQCGLRNSYNIGQVFGVNNFSWGLARVLLQNSQYYSAHNYWTDKTGDNANMAAELNYSTEIINLFGSSAWPSNVQWGNEWILGNWNNGNPIYPKLYYEN